MKKAPGDANTARWL